jgi:methionine--tRNA ligase beta chain
LARKKGHHGRRKVISYEDFQKLDLRVAKVLEAQRVEESRKLLQLQVDIGGEKRQVIAGVGSVYEPEDLVSREIIVIINLEPKMLMGLESQGMLLATDSESGPVLLQPDKEVEPGSRIK